jgi:hypothetical protein
MLRIAMMLITTVTISLAMKLIITVRVSKVGHEDERRIENILTVRCFICPLLEFIL